MWRWRWWWQRQRQAGLPRFGRPQRPCGHLMARGQVLKQAVIYVLLAANMSSSWPESNRSSSRPRAQGLTKRFGEIVSNGNISHTFLYYNDYKNVLYYTGTRTCSFRKSSFYPQVPVKRGIVQCTYLLCGGTDKTPHCAFSKFSKVNIAANRTVFPSYFLHILQITIRFLARVLDRNISNHISLY